MKFEKYPFEKLDNLLQDVNANAKFEPISLTIGEPSFATPLSIQNELKDKTSYLQKYPKSAGEKFLKEAMISFVSKRFQVQLQSNQLIPTFGTREVLFNFPQFLLSDIKNPVMAFTNPFYQIYEGSAIASRAKVLHINLTKDNDFQAKLSNKELKKCHLVILNYPNNPTSGTMDLKGLKWWVKKAIKYNFVLLNDECYSEIYIGKKPNSLLQASLEVGNKSFKNILVINSISKRNSSPGLRSGFIAGDSKILQKYMRYRTYLGTAIPLPLQYASSVAWRDFKSADKFKKLYKQNLILAKDILGIKIPKATFYIWLEVENDLNWTKELYKAKNIKVLPGRFLGRDGMGEDYVRIALVQHPKKTKKTLQRLKDFIDEYNS